MSHQPFFPTAYSPARSSTKPVGFRSARVIAVGGGKGGVGKSFLTVNLGAVLAREGARVVLVDTDLEGANLHTCLRVPAPPVSLADFVAQREVDLGKLLVETPIPNLRLVAGTHSNLATAHPGHALRSRLLEGLRALSADFVLVDLGAGNDPACIDYFLVSDEGLVVMTPEPTAVENAYAFLRAAFYRRMRMSMLSRAARTLVTHAMDQRNERGIRTPLDLLREVQHIDSEEGCRFVESMQLFHPRIVLNQVRTATDVKLGFAVRSVCHKYFGIDAEYLGYVNDDAAVRESVVARRPLVDVHPQCDAAIYLRRIARKVAAGPSEAMPSSSLEGARR